MNTLNFDPKTQRFQNLYPIKTPKMTLKQNLHATQKILYKSSQEIPTSKIPQIKHDLEHLKKPEIGSNSSGLDTLRFCSISTVSLFHMII